MGAKRLILYGAGQLGIMLLARYFMQWVLKFAEEGKGTETGALFAVATVGTLFLGFRIFDAVTDPLAGRFGDFWVQKGRQRRSLIWLSFLIPAIGLVLVFSPTSSMVPVVRWGLLLTGMFLFFVGYTLYAVPFWSLVEDYSQGNERTRTALSNSLGVGVLLATGIGFVGSPPIIASVGYLNGALIFSGVALFFMVMPYFAAPKGAKSVEVPPLPPLGKTLKASLSHRRFLSVILLFAGAQMSLTVMTSAAPFIAVRLLDGTVKDVALLLAPFLGTAVPTFVFVPWLSRRLGWEKATALGVLALSVAYIGAGLLGNGYFGLTPVQTAMLVFACAGPGAAFVLGLEGEAVVRCAQDSEHKSVGVYFGIYNFIVKALNGVAVFMTGILAALDGKLPVRLMPISAGVLCIAGVVVYGMMKNRREKSPESP